MLNKNKHWYIGLAVITIMLVGAFLLKAPHPTTPTPKNAPKEGITMKKTPSGKKVLDIQHWVTEEGVRVYFVPVPALPMVDIELIFDAGAARNGDKGGLAYLTNNLFADGTAKMNADQVAENFENVGAQFSAESSRDMAILQLRTLSAPTERKVALDTFAAILNEPLFPEGGFAREKSNMLSTLQQQAQTPSQIASRAFYTTVFDQTPYANWVLGSPESLKTLSINDVKDFYRKYYVAENVVVAIVGDVSQSEANLMARQLTQHLPKGEKASAFSPIKNRETNEVKKIPFASKQTHIVIGSPGIKQGDPDLYPLYVGNHVLGGNGSVTQLFDVIRNKHGLAYSVYSHFMPMRERGPFMVGCQTRSDQADKARALMEKVLNDFVASGPSTEELNEAKQNLLGGYALQFDSNTAICRQIATLGFYELPLDYFDQFKEAINKVTVEDVKKAFSKHIAANKMAVVMVGPTSPASSE